MVEILELPEARRLAVPLSVAAYQALEEQGLVDCRTELIRGVIIEKMSKSPLHTMVTLWLFRAVDAAVAGRFHVRSEAPLILADSVPEPDLAVVEGVDEDYVTRHPRSARLVAEVCVSSEAMDRQMAEIYAEAGIGEFWLVLPLRNVVECHWQPQAGRYTQTRTYEAGSVLESPTIPGLSLQLKSLFRKT